MPSPEGITEGHKRQGFPAQCMFSPENAVLPLLTGHMLAQGINGRPTASPCSREMQAPLEMGTLQHSRVGGCYKVVFQWREVKGGNSKELTDENKICVRARCVAWGRNKNFSILNLNYFALTLSCLVHVLQVCVFSKEIRRFYSISQSL